MAPSIETLDVTIDYNMTIQEMIEAGRYDSINQDIAGNFQPPHGGWGHGSFQKTLYLVCFNRFMEFEEVLYELSIDPWRPGLLPDQLAIGAEHPDKQREFPIVQVGSLWMIRGFHRGTYLRRANKERMLSKVWLNMGFNSYYRFVAEKYKTA